MHALFWRPNPDSEEQKTPSVATATEDEPAILGEAWMPSPILLMPSALALGFCFVFS